MRTRSLLSASVTLVAGLLACSTTPGGEPQGPAVTLLKVAADSQTLDWGASVQHIVEARDAVNAPRPDVAISWQLTGTGSLSSITTSTGADGRASVAHALGATSGPETVTARAAGIATPVTFTTFAVGPAAVLVGLPLDNQVYGTGDNIQHTVETRDAQGARRAGVTIQWSAAGGGTISPSTNETGADGRASVTHLLGSTPGTQLVSATAPAIGGGSLPVTFTTFVATRVTAGGNNQFGPASVTIKKGEYVIWYFVIMFPHNVTFTTAGAPANIPNTTITPIPRKFDTAGTFNYECTNHPGMTGSVVVNP